MPRHAYRILVTGSRSWPNPAPVADVLDAQLAALPAGGTLTVVVGYDPQRRYPPGVDKITYEYCESVAAFAERQGKALVAETHPADWQAPCRPECDHGPRPVNRRGRDYCPAAGDYRNVGMVVRGARFCLAFIMPCAKPRCRKKSSHGSHGAAHCAALAEAAGIETTRYRLTAAGVVVESPKSSPARPFEQTSLPRDVP